MSFPAAARRSLANTQLRANLARATTTIRDKRARVVGELPDWEELRAAGAAVKDEALLDLDAQLERLEESVAAAGGQVHWAADGAEACEIVARVARSHGLRELVKVKSIASDEIKLNEALAAAGVSALETDLAELIIQLGDDSQSHILVPAIHRNRAEIRDLFRRELGLPDLPDDPPALTEAARLHLRSKFLEARMGVSGANFAIAETGTVCVVESEGNGRMCTTLPDVLVTLMGVEKVVPAWRDMEVFLQLLPRSSTGERMNPYTSFWSGVREGDGPSEFHLVLLDNGRTAALADEVGRQALRCIRCSACLNVCPVYARVGGHAYESVYPGPIGAILTPQLKGMEEAGSLPYASSLCGACAEVCPVKIEIPRLLTHLRARERDEAGSLDPELLSMKGLYRRVLVARALRARPEAGPRGRPAARPARPDNARAGPAVRLDDLARPAGPGRGELPRLVAAHARRVAGRRRSPRRPLLRGPRRAIRCPRATAFRPRGGARPHPRRRRGRAGTRRAAARLPHRGLPLAGADRRAVRGARGRVPRDRPAGGRRRRRRGARRAHLLGARSRAARRGARPGGGVAARGRRARRGRGALRQPSSTSSAAPSPAARSRSPRPGASCSTAARGREGARSRSSPTCTSASCARSRSWGWSRRRWRGSRAPSATVSRSPSSPARRRPRTSSSTGSRECTGRASCTCCW